VSITDNKRLVAGTKQTLSQIKKGSVAAVFIAQDADEQLIEKIKSECEKNNVEIRYAKSMKLLGKACAISRGAACAAILKNKEGGERSNAND